MQLGTGHHKMITRDADSSFMPLVNQLIILKVYIYVWALISLATSAFSKLSWVRGYRWYPRQMEEARIWTIQVMLTSAVRHVSYTTPKQISVK